MARALPTILAMLLLGVAAPGCGDDDEAPPPPTVASEIDDPVERAVTVGKTIKADPERTEAILEEHGMTVEELEELMYEIAADPEMSADYEAAMGE